MNKELYAKKSNIGIFYDVVPFLFFLAFGIMLLNMIRVIMLSVIKNLIGIGSVIMICFCIGILGIIIGTFLLLIKTLKKIPTQLRLENEKLIITDYFSTYSLNIYEINNILKKRKPNQFLNWQYVIIFNNKEIRVDPVHMKGVDSVVEKPIDLTELNLAE